MLEVGDKFPEFQLTASISDENKESFKEITQDSYPGKWLVIFSWPKDFTFVCPTEIKGFADLSLSFKEKNAVVLGLSIDSEFVHAAWKKYEEKLHNLPIPMLSDFKRELTERLGILDNESGAPQRATFIVDPEGTIRFIMVTDPKVGRNPHEVFRVLTALQTEKLCPCNWQAGQPTLN